MMLMKKYVDIERLKDKFAEAFKVGEHITITEKIDGANASIAVGEDGKLIAFSRRNELTPESNLQGFYEYVQSLDPTMISCVLGTRYIFFGEWLVKHTIKYPQEKMKQFYVFDVWDTEIEQYIPWEQTKQMAEFCGLKMVPVFYDGPFISWEHVYSFVGKTEMGGEPTGEGVVIKSQDRLDNKFSGTPAYVKIVAKEFSEVHQSKPQKDIDPAKIAARQAAEALAETIVTPRRVEKAIQKFVEDGIVPENWDEKDLGTIAKNLPRAIYNDCVKEEPETVAQIENFGKICGSLSMKLARGLIK
jgi:hypothetical protein